MQPNEVNDLVKQFDGMSQMMTALAGKGIRERMKMVRELQSTMANNPEGGLARKKVGTGKRLTPAEKAKLRKQRDKEIRKKKREGRGGDG